MLDAYGSDSEASRGGNSVVDETVDAVPVGAATPERPAALLATNGFESDYGSDVEHEKGALGDFGTRMVVPAGLPTQDHVPHTGRSLAVFAMEGLVPIADNELDFFKHILLKASQSASDNSFCDSIYGKQLSHIVETRLGKPRASRSATWQNAASASNIAGDATKADARQYSQRYVEQAECLKASSELLAAATASRQLQRFRLKLDIGLLLLFTSQSDEASKQMRITDETRRIWKLDHKAIEDEHNSASVKDFKNCKQQSILVPCKVQYTELAVTMVVQDTQTKDIHSKHFNLLTHLEHFDRTTAENLNACQETLFCIPGFDQEFMSYIEHVGVAPAQDQAGGNQRQLNEGYRSDKLPVYGGKRRFRLATSCGVHNWARCITASFYQMQALIGQMIAFAINQRLPDKLPQLRKIIGHRLRTMCHIVRTPQLNYCETSLPSPKCKLGCCRFAMFPNRLHV